jgi:hypothetical protein
LPAAIVGWVLGIVILIAAESEIVVDILAAESFLKITIL